MFRYIVLHSVIGSVIVWGVLNGVFMLRGFFHGITVAYMACLETAALLIVFPFTLAIAYYQWKKLERMSLAGGEK